MCVAMSRCMCAVWLWLSEFSDDALSCFKFLFRSVICLYVVVYSLFSLFYF